jgi:perosamine synthetase
MTFISKTKIEWWKTDLGDSERQEMLNAFDDKRFTVSSSVATVESLISNILNIPYVVMTNSGSSAILMALLALDINHEDEIIVPDLTWIATAQAPAILGAKVVACDTFFDKPIIDISLIEQKITRKTKAIIPVHLNGRFCDMYELKKIAVKHNISIIEDACKGLFSSFQGKFFGTFGDLGCFSLGMISPISIGFGGVVVTSSQQLYEKLILIRDHGVKRNPECLKSLGFNFKVSDILASIAIPQLKNYKFKINSLIKIHNYYEENLNSKSVTLLKIDKLNGSVPVYVEGYSDRREDVISYLNNNNISISRYHNPVNSAQYLFIKEQPNNNSKRFSDNGFIMPSGPSQDLRDIDIVIDLLNRI